MAARRTINPEYRKYVLRIPPALYGRVDAEATRRGLSMNKLIALCLERELARLEAEQV